MAEYGRIYKKLWRNKKFKKSTDDGKIVILYVYTSPHSNMIGYYYLPIEYIVVDLKWTPARIKKAFREGLDKGFFEYDFESNIVMVSRWFEYNGNFNTNQLKKAVGELSEVPDNQLAQQFESYVKGFSEPLWEAFRKGIPKKTLCSVTVPGTIPVTIETDIPFEEIIKDLNEKADKKYRYTGLGTQDLIKARWSEGWRLPDFQAVHTNKCRDWLGDAEYNKYLRPETLYRPKHFESYLNEKEILSEEDQFVKSINEDIAKKMAVDNG